MLYMTSQSTMTLNQSHQSTNHTTMTCQVVWVFSVNKANVQLNLDNMDMKKTSQNQAQAND